jgi:hypothetical protein
MDIENTLGISYDDTVSFGRILNAAGIFDTVSDVLDYFVNPQAYSNYLVIHQELGSPIVGAANWDAFLSRSLALVNGELSESSTAV